MKRNLEQLKNNVITLRFGVIFFCLDKVLFRRHITFNNIFYFFKYSITNSRKKGGIIIHTEKIRQLARSMRDEIIEMRRYLHRHPELSYQEHETADFIQKKLREYGIPYRSEIAGTGILGIIKGKHEGRTVALRADMDALPIQEENDHSYVSVHEGVMHACGHDAHMAMLLGAAKILKNLQDEIYGTVLLVFQPAEEKSPVGGAIPMMEAGVFEDFMPDVIYAQHVWPYLPAGQIGIRDREMLGASDNFKVILKGVGGHASLPHLTTDPIVTAGFLIVSLQTIVSRSLDPRHPSVLTIGSIHGGTAHNVIGNTVTLEGSIRTFGEDTRKRIKERFYEITTNVAEMYNNEVEIDYQEGYPATVNTPRWARLARRSAQNLFGKDATPMIEPAMASEDFSRFLEKIPGAYIFLGAQMENSEEQKGLHDPRFNINEEVLPMGAAFLAKVAIDTLNELKENTIRIWID